MKKKDEKIPLRKRILFARWDRMVNMTPTQIRDFRNSKESEGISQTSEEAKKVGASVLSGIEASKKIEKIIAKAAPYRNQYDKLPNWSSDEWELVGRQVRMISRARANVGDLIGDDGEPKPKLLSLYLWGRDEQKTKSFPNKDAVKKEVMDDVKKEKEAEQKKEKKLSESFFTNLLSL